MAFDYAHGQTTLGELELHGIQHEATGKFRLTSVTIEGQLAIPTCTFVKSLCERFALSETVQNQRSSGELLSLLVRSFPEAQIDYRVEWDESGTTWLFPGASKTVNSDASPSAADPADIPSPDHRLEQYGFKNTASLATTEPHSDIDQDWPLLRDTNCHVPSAPLLPGDPATASTLFMNSPVGTPRPSVN